MCIGVLIVGDMLAGADTVVFRSNVRDGPQILTSRDIVAVIPEVVGIMFASRFIRQMTGAIAFGGIVCMCFGISGNISPDAVACFKMHGQLTQVWFSDV